MLIREQAPAKLRRARNTLRRRDYPIAALAVLLVLLHSQSPAWAEVQHPVFVASGFQFGQVGLLCVMPLIDARKNLPNDDLEATRPVLEAMRPVLMSKLHAKGYRLLDPSCSRDADANTQRTRSRWILTVRLDDFVGPGAGPFVSGSLLTASLFDTESIKEVWRDTAMTRFGGRVANALLDKDINGIVTSGIVAVLAKFERQKSTPPPSPATIWAPMSLNARLYKSHSFSTCDGLLRFDSGGLSFEPFLNGKQKDKCASFQFSMPGTRIKTGPLSWISVPGKGKFFLQEPDEMRVLYLFLALQSLR